MKELIAISFMTRRTSIDRGEFHFKGAFNGLYIKLIEVSGLRDFEIDLGEEYIMYLGMIGYDKEDSRLRAQLTKLRSIDDLRGDI